MQSYDRLLPIGFFLLLPLLAGQDVPSPPAAAQRGVKLPGASSTEPVAELNGKTYALLIGVSRYKNDPPIASLQYADKDAESFAELLKTPIAGELKEPDEIRLLTNEKATRAAIDDAVKDLGKAHAGPNNTLILFVGAHGVYLTEEEDPVTHRKIQKDPYVLLYDTNIQDAKTTGYPMEEFRRMVAEQAMKFGRVLIFLDVCHAQNVAGIAGGSEVQDAVKRAWQGQAGELGLMMASHAGESAIESASFGGGHGAFSYFLLSGWNGPAAVGDTSITFADLAQYVRANVRKFTRKAQDPFDQAPNTDMVVVPDVRKPGLPMLPAQLLSEQEIRDVRRRRGAPVQTPAANRPARERQDAFDAAIAHGLLLPEEPGSAANQLAAFRNDPAQSPQAIQDRERHLRIALEDRGQEVMYRYLEGEEEPQNKADFDRCARDFEEALKLSPGADFNRGRALFCRGRAQIFAGQYDDAQRLLDASIGIDSRRAYAYNALGIAYLERIARNGQGFDEAERAFRAAMRFAPYWAYPVHTLALLSSERGDYDGAIALYQYAMSIAPRYSYLPYNLGLLYERLGDLESAQRWFEKALDVLDKSGQQHGVTWPDRGRVFNALGTVARSNGREARALEYFHKALVDDPEDRNARHNLALLLAKRNEYREADDLWLANIAADRNFLPSRVAYAESLAIRNRFTDACDQYERLVADKPQYVGAREALAKLYIAQNQPERALSQLDAALAQSPSNPALLELRGDANARMCRTAAALEDWKKASGIASDRATRSRLSRKMKSLSQSG